MQARLEDLVAPDIRRMYEDHDLHNKRLPDQKRFGSIFREFRLVPSGISVTDVPLERINIHGRQGAPAIEIWREDVAPAFGFETEPN